MIRRSYYLQSLRGGAHIHLKVLIYHRHPFALWCAPSWLAPRLAQEFPDTSFVHLADDERLLEEIPDADVFIGSFLKPDPFRAASRLRWIHSPAAAVHQLLFSELLQSNVFITNSRDVHGPVVAEHAIALVLALAKRLPQAMRHQARSEWGQAALWQEQPRPREVSGATVVVVGMGSIGREFTVRAKALGMRVLAVRESPEKGAEGADEVFGQADVGLILPQADYVVLCTPVTPSMTRWLNAERLSSMKPDAYIVNVGRGALVDEAALLDALRSGKIAGAGLDVFSEEPLPKDSPFWGLENVLITPHTAAVTERVWERHCRLISENLRRLQDGGTLLNLVDKRRGY